MPRKKMTASNQLTICKRCGEKYDWYNQEPPDGVSFYWVPKCPACGAQMTEKPVNDKWIELTGMSLNKNQEEYEKHRKKVHYQARLYHGKLTDKTVPELIELAQYFDDYANHNVLPIGPSPSRDIAFKVRKQARRQLKEQ